MQQSLLSYLRKLRNHEFAEAYELICDKLEVEESAPANVLQAVVSVQEYAGELKFLKIAKRKHPISEQMKRLKNERHQYLLSLRGRVTYLLKSPDVGERDSANVLRPLLLAYHEFFSSASIHSQSRLVSNLSTELVDGPQFVEALEELNLVGTISTIKSITNEMRTLHLQRLQETKASMALAKQIRDTAYAHLTTMWKAIEVALSLKTTNAEACTKLFDVTNWVIISFKAQYLSKTTRRENEKLKAQADNEFTNEPEV